MQDSGEIPSETKHMVKSVTEQKQPFTLKEQCDDQGQDVNGFIDTDIMYGMAMHFNGYSDYCSNDYNGTPVYIEKYEGDLRVVVYSDINQEDPTHVISLEGAKVEKRKDLRLVPKDDHHRSGKPH